MADPTDPKPETFDKAFVDALRNEAAGHRLKAQETQQKLDALTADHTALKAKYDTAEAARVTAESAALEARKGADARVLGVELKAAATAAGLIDADDLRLVDTAALKLNDKGEVEGLGDLLDGLKASKPHLFKAAEAAPAAPGVQAPPSSSNPITPPAPKAPGPKHAKDLTPEEYAAEKARIISGR